jgi:N-acetylmuramoyl-L-alanine amidase
MKKTVIIVHHAGKGGERSTFRSIRAWHVGTRPNGNGWSDIGYHAVIEKDGTVQRGRKDENIGAHTRGWNRQSLGVCVCGNFEHQLVQTKQWNALIDQITRWCLEHAISPGSDTIVGHRDKQPTKTFKKNGRVVSKPNTCPGKNLYRYLPWLRKEVRNRWMRHMA